MGKFVHFTLSQLNQFTELVNEYLAKDSATRQWTWLCPVSVTMSTDTRQQTPQDQYKSLQPGDSRTRAHVTALVFHMLLVPQHGQITDFSSNLLKDSLEDNPNWEPKKVSKALEYLETYALNLYNSPWRDEFKNIKVYTGFFRLKVSLYIKDAEGILRRMGYVQKSDDAMALTLAESVDRDGLLELAYLLFVLQVECDIHRQIYERVKAHGHTIEQVHECRRAIGGGVDECVKWIRSKYGPVEKPIVDQLLRVDIDTTDVARTHVPGRWTDEVLSHTVQPRVVRLPPRVNASSGHRNDLPSSGVDIGGWMQNSALQGEYINNPRTFLRDADDDIYAPRTAEEHRMLSYRAVSTTERSLPPKPCALSTDEQSPAYVEFLSRSVGIGHTAGSTGSQSMDFRRNHTDGVQHLSHNPFPINFADIPVQQGGLTTSRSRDAVSRRADFPLRTHPDTFATNRCSLYDNVDPGDARGRATRESPVSKQASEMTLL